MSFNTDLAVLPVNRDSIVHSCDHDFKDTKQKFGLTYELYQLYLRGRLTRAVPEEQRAHGEVHTRRILCEADILLSEIRCGGGISVGQNTKSCE